MHTEEQYKSLERVIYIGKKTTMPIAAVPMFCLILGTVLMLFNPLLGLCIMFSATLVMFGCASTYVLCSELSQEFDKNYKYP